jgi:hypothetical protein
VCSWIALGARVFIGGVPYRGKVLRHAATPMRVLRARLATTARPSLATESRRRSA